MGVNSGRCELLSTIAEAIFNFNRDPCYGALGRVLAMPKYQVENHEPRCQ